MIYLLSTFSILCSFLFSADHLLLKKVCVRPDNGEMVVIYNPTDDAISLDGYYLSDNKKYYDLPSGDPLTTSYYNDFLIEFPDIEIAAGSERIISLQEASNYTAFYGSDYTPDLSISDNIDYSTTTTLNDKLSDDSEIIILFYWDGASSIVTDIDYFAWGDGISNLINKSSKPGYQLDTAENSQNPITTVHEDYYTYRRVDLNEGTETSSGGNGFGGDDETSENINTTWEVTNHSMFPSGCTDSRAPNYDSDAVIDDESCNIIEGCTDSDAVNFDSKANVDDGSCAKLELEPYPFIPQEGEVIKYYFEQPATEYRFIIRVFDISGRFITTLVDETNQDGTLFKTTREWDGTTHLGEVVFPGTYLFHLEVTEFATGKSSGHVYPVVVGAN